MTNASPLKILVTNDDGIDSVGLHRLANAVAEHGEVTVVAPDREFSGAGAAVGALWEFEPEVERRSITGVDSDHIWTVNGPPALCVLYARMGLFGEPDFDLVVSGINPGANVGRSVYHSGTIGACLTARNGGWSGVAVSQMFPNGFEGQAMAEVVERQVWDTAAHVASRFVGSILDATPADEPFVANINVPNCDIEHIKGVRRSDVGVMPPATMTQAQLEPTGVDNKFGVKLSWGSTNDQNPAGTDARDVADGYVTVSYLSRLVDHPRTDLPSADRFAATLK